MTQRQQQAHLRAKRGMTLTAEALLAGDPDRVEKAERALAMLREAEQPSAPNAGNAVRIGARPRFRAAR